MAEKAVAENLPTVSVIIPMRNEASYIEECLQSVVEQDYPQALVEILVVDGMSEDRSPSIVSEFISRHPNIRLLSNPRQATTCALNQGILESKGEVVVRVDAHCWVAGDYVSSCVKALQRAGADNVGGLMRPEGKTFVEKAIAIVMCSPFGVGSGKFHYCEKEMFVDTVYLGAYRREVFDRIGLYDEGAHYGEDDELNYRLTRAGGKILLCPDIKTKYRPRSSLIALWRQFFNYGRGKVRTVKKHGGPASWRHLVPAAFVLSAAGGLLLYAINPSFWWIGTSIAVTYLVSALLVSARISAKEGWIYFPLLPVIFGVLHLGYGTGFLWGVLRLYLLERIHGDAKSAQLSKL